MALITRSIGPDAKGSKLSFVQMDNNLYFLQSIGYTGGTYENNTLILTNPTGGTIETKIESFSRNFIPSGTSITIYEDYQNLIFGDLVVQGELNIENNAELVVLNGAIVVSGGTINNSGLTYSITLPEYNTFLTNATLDSNTKKLSFTGNFGFVPFDTDLSPLVFTGGTITGATSFTNGLSATTISATTLQSSNTFIESTGYLYFGNSSTDGSWRMSISGANFIVEKRVSGNWIISGTFN